MLDMCECWCGWSLIYTSHVCDQFSCNFSQNKNWNSLSKNGKRVLFEWRLFWSLRNVAFVVCISCRLGLISSNKFAVVLESVCGFWNCCGIRHHEFQAVAGDCDDGWVHALPVGDAALANELARVAANGDRISCDDDGDDDDDIMDWVCRLLFIRSVLLSLWLLLLLLLLAPPPPPPLPPTSNEPPCGPSLLP